MNSLEYISHPAHPLRSVHINKPWLNLDFAGVTARCAYNLFGITLLLLM